MSDLDRKLFDIVKHAANEDGYVEDSIAVREIGRIKEAFKEAGWMIPLSSSEHSDTRAKASYYAGYLDQAMTGQEWYDRFESYLVGNVAWLTSSPGTIKEKVLHAAKRASVLEEK